MPILGSNGLLSAGAYTRVDEFEDAITCALSFIKNEAYFPEG
jgi:hypothetical protein